MICKEPVDPKKGDVRQKRAFTIYTRTTHENKRVWFGYVWKLQAYRMREGWETVETSIERWNIQEKNYETRKTRRRQLETEEKLSSFRFDVGTES